jgi:Tfp pilus assembly protein PilV
MRHIKLFAPVRSIPNPSAGRYNGRKKRPLTGGFAILEVAMATFVLAFGIATAIVAMQAGFRHLDLARGTTLAAQIIQSEMERIRMMSWTGVSAIPATETFDGATNFSSTSRIVGRYSVTRTLTADTARPTEVMNISIAVTWKTYDGRPHTRSFNSIYAKNGLYDYYYTTAHTPPP